MQVPAALATPVSTPGPTPSTPRGSSQLPALKAEVAKAHEYFRSLGVTAAEGIEPFKYASSSQLRGIAYDGAKDFIVVGAPKPGLVDSVPAVDNELAGRLVAERIAKRMGVGPEYQQESLPQQVALMTHLGDVLASAYDKDDWTIGEGTNAKPQRDMQDPHRLGMPATADEAVAVMERLQPKITDIGQLIKVSEVMASVPDRAAAQIGDKLGRDEMAKLYLSAMRSGLVHDSMGVGPFAFRVAATAAGMYGPDSLQHRAVRDAFAAVGLLSADGQLAGAFD